MSADRSRPPAGLFEARMVIGDSRTAGSQSFESTNPYSGESWARVPAATPGDVDDAVQAARTAFEGDWGRTPGVERSRLMHRLADALEADAERMSRLESTDNGKVIRETGSQIRFAARNLRFFAGYADKIYGRTIPLDRPGVFDWTVRRPHGVAALITAWNSPIALLANKLPPALATGNAVVIKPSEHASVTTCELAEMALAVGLPPGVVNVVTGAGPVGDRLIRHHGIDKVSFTGGSDTGARVAQAAAARSVPVTLELGGKSPNIIFADADVERAVVGAIAGIFAAAGQTCIAGSRLLVQAELYERVVSEVAAWAGRIRLGDPLLPGTEMGPVANRPQFERILAMIEHGRQDGGRLVAGGAAASAPHLPPGGLFIQPTVLADMKPDMSLAREEVFGPVLSILRFDTEAEAIELANNGRYGLAAGVWTRDIARAHRVVDCLQAGTVWINTYRSTAAQAPFGGTKASGYGRERGAEALSEYSYVQNVMLDYSDEARDPFAIRV